MITRKDESREGFQQVTFYVPRKSDRPLVVTVSKWGDYAPSVTYPSTIMENQCDLVRLATAMLMAADIVGEWSNPMI